jgi:PAS domain S-box-containing protein
MRTRKTTESALRESEERYRAVVAALEEGIILLEADGSISSCNASACRILGQTEEQILGRTCSDVQGGTSIHEDGSPCDPEALPGKVTLRTGEPCSQFVLGFDRPDGERRWISVNSRPLARPGEPRPYAVVVSFSDITSRKRIEEERSRLQAVISRSALEWRLTFDSIPSPLLLLETDGRIIRMNEAARLLAGVTYDRAIDHPLPALGESQPWPAAQALVEQVAGTSARAAAQVRDARGRTWDLSVNPVASPHGDRWLIVVALDVTDLVKLQDSLRKSETMSAMGGLVAGVAHEVRNPLFGISATLDAFESRFQNRTEYRRYFEILKDRVQRLNELMQQLLDYGKPIRLEMEDICVRKVAREAIQACAPLAAAAGVEIAAKLPSEMPPVRGDRMRILQVFENLLENAIQHSPQGGRVVVRVGAAGDGERARFSIEDAGPGFRPEDLDRIFEPFFTRRRGGTGLGLSIVQRIVEQHEGEISAGNRPEGGAVMSVTLPLLPRTSRVSGP